MIPCLVLAQIKAIFGEDLTLPLHIDRLLPAKDGWQGTEHDLQVNYFKWLAELRTNDPYMHLIHAIPNGGKRDKITAGQLVAEGAKAGVPDVFHPFPSRSASRYVHGDMMQYFGLYIEFKRAGLKPSEEQRAMLLMLDAKGYKVIVTNDLDIAKQEFMTYYYG